MKILFMASCSPVVSDPAASATFYVEELGLSLDQRAGDYVFSEKLSGTKHFGLWPLREAARACFGDDRWPPSVPVPQASIEFEVDDVAAAAREMEARGHRPLHATRTEPWGQTIARFLSPDGLIIGLCHTPGLPGP